MLRERLRRKEELLQDYEKDLARLRQAEILIREKDLLIEDLQVISLLIFSLVYLHLQFIDRQTFER